VTLKTAKNFTTTKNDRLDAHAIGREVCLFVVVGAWRYLKVR